MSRFRIKRRKPFGNKPGAATGAGSDPKSSGGVGVEDPGLFAFIQAACEATQPLSDETWDRLAEGVKPQLAEKLYVKMLQRDETLLQLVSRKASQLIVTGMDEGMDPALREAPARALLRRHGPVIGKNEGQYMAASATATYASLDLLEYGFQRGLNANEVYLEKGKPVGSGLDSVTDTAIQSTSPQMRDHTVGAIKIFLKHGANPDRLMHCDMEGNRPPMPITQWLREDHGVQNIGELVGKLEAKTVFPGQRAPLVTLAVPGELGPAMELFRRQLLKGQGGK